MDKFILIGSAFSIFFAVLIYSKPRRQVPDVILSTWFLILTIHLVFYYLDLTNLHYVYPHILGISGTITFLYGPFHFLYVTTYISKSDRFKKVYWLHFLPFLINNLINTPFYLLDNEQKLNAYFTNMYQTPYLFETLTVLKIILLPVYLACSWFLLKKHEKRIQDYYSSIKNKNLRWLKNLTIAFAVFWLFIISVIVFEKLFNKVTLVTMNEIPIYTIQSVLIIVFGYFGFKQGSIFSQLQNENNQASIKYQRSGLKEEEANFYLNKLLDYMRTEKPYLNGELTIMDVSDKTGISRHTLTQIINQKLRKNFYQFINTYRIKETKKRILDPDYENLTILAIGFDSGFNSKSTFNAIFKKATDMTPSEYRKYVQSTKQTLA